MDEVPKSDSDGHSRLKVEKINEVKNAGIRKFLTEGMDYNRKKRVTPENKGNILRKEENREENFSIKEELKLKRLRGRKMEETKQEENEELKGRKIMKNGRMIIEVERKEEKLIETRKRELGIKEEKGNGKKTFYDEEKGRKNSMEEEKIEKEKGKVKEGNKRGRKRESERGILMGEQSIKNFMINKKEKEIVNTPKRKRKEKEEIMVFGKEETPGKKMKYMLDNDQNNKSLEKEGGKVKRMLETLEGGRGKIRTGMRKHSTGGKLSDLRNGKRDSSRIQKGKVQTQIERINFNLNAINSGTSIYSYNEEKGALNNKQLGHKIDLIAKKNSELVQSVHNRGGTGVQHADESVIANDNSRLDDRQGGPIRRDFNNQLGLEHGRNKL